LCPKSNNQYGIRRKGKAIEKCPMPDIVLAFGKNGGPPHKLRKLKPNVSEGV